MTKRIGSARKFNTVRKRGKSFKIYNNCRLTKNFKYIYLTGMT